MLPLNYAVNRMLLYKKVRNSNPYAAGGYKFGHYKNTKWCKKPEKWLKPWHNDMDTPPRILRELYNEYQNDRV